MAIMQQDAFNDGRTQPGHALGEPRGDMAAMEGRVGKSGSLHNLIVSPAAQPGATAMWECSGIS